MKAKQQFVQQKTWSCQFVLTRWANLRCFFYSFCWDPGHCWLVPIATFFLQLTSSGLVLGFLGINEWVGITAKNDLKSHFSRIFDHKMLSSLHWHRIISPPCAFAIFPAPLFLFQRPLLISQLAGLRDTTAGLPRVKWGFLPRTPFPCPCKAPFSLEQKDFLAPFSLKQGDATATSKAA